MSRYDIARHIATLDPEREHAEVMHWIAGYEFPWDYIRALEMALYRTFCAPTTSALLDKTREFQNRPQRRYDDTALLMAEIIEWGYDSDRGKEALRRINRFHRTYDIANEDFLYVLSTFHLEPIRWIARYGWRPLTPSEVQASYFFWREVGRRMNIRDIPPSHDAFEAWSLEHERTRFAYSDANKRVATATRELFVSWAPRPLHGFVRTAIHSLLDDTMRTCFGFPEAPKAMTTFVTGALRTRGRLLRLFPGHRQKQFITTKRQRSWPNGYKISDLGPPPLLATMNAPMAESTEEQASGRAT